MKGLLLISSITGLCILNSCGKMASTSISAADLSSELSSGNISEVADAAADDASTSATIIARFQPKSTDVTVTRTCSKADSTGVVTVNIDV